VQGENERLQQQFHAFFSGQFKPQASAGAHGRHQAFGHGHVDDFFALDYFRFQWGGGNLALALFGAFDWLFYSWFDWLFI
jgi:hypothetical protein